MPEYVTMKEIRAASPAVELECDEEFLARYGIPSAELDVPRLCATLERAVELLVNWYEERNPDCGCRLCQTGDFLKAVKR